MESANQLEPSSEPPPSKLAHLLGIAIALLAVTFPFFAIARFSSPSSEVLQVPNYPLVRARD